MLNELDCPIFLISQFSRIPSSSSSYRHFDLKDGDDDEDSLFSGIPVFRYSGVQVFRCSGVTILDFGLDSSFILPPSAFLLAFRCLNVAATDMPQSRKVKGGSEE